MKILKNFLLDIELDIEIQIDRIKKYFAVKKYKKLYPNYEENQYNCGSIKHIWGITSWDDLSGKNASLYSMNDIDITFDRDTKEYMLGIETAYIFNGNVKEGECKYLRQLLDAFTKYMDDNNFSKDNCIGLFFNSPSISTRAESIEELYSNFRIFVEGYCKVCGY